MPRGCVFSALERTHNMINLIFSCDSNATNAIDRRVYLVCTGSETIL